MRNSFVQFHFRKPKCPNLIITVQIEMYMNTKVDVSQTFFVSIIKRRVELEMRLLCNVCTKIKKTISKKTPS